MAITQDKECYTKWTHVENGKVLVRRIHRIEVQARNGGLYTLRGDKLPLRAFSCSEIQRLSAVRRSPTAFFLPLFLVRE